MRKSSHSLGSDALAAENDLKLSPARTCVTHFMQVPASGASHSA